MILLHVSVISWRLITIEEDSHKKRQTRREGHLLRERKFDDALMEARVTTHFIPMAAAGDGKVRERRIDVLLTLDAYDAALSKKIDFIVLVTGDGDFVPLV